MASTRKELMQLLQHLNGSAQAGTVLVSPEKINDDTPKRIVRAGEAFDLGVRWVYFVEGNRSINVTSRLIEFYGSALPDVLCNGWVRILGNPPKMTMDGRPIVHEFKGVVFWRLDTDDR